MNVNLRAARNLVNTVHATREQQRSALLTMERNIGRQERALRRLQTYGWVIPLVAATAVIAALLGAAWVQHAHGEFHPHGVQVPLLLLLTVGAPSLTVMLTADIVERRVITAEREVAHHADRREQLQQLIGRLNVTVKESEQELAAREQAAA